MVSKPWADIENDLIVADYFAMLAEDIAQRPYSKAEHKRMLMPLLDGRSEKSIEFKHQNISAVLIRLGEIWIPGYKPRFNFQKSLIDAVARWLKQNPNWSSHPIPAESIQEATHLQIVSPPTHVDFLPIKEREKQEQILHISDKLDAAGRDERNRALGRAGEERVFEHERFLLANEGRDDLARKVRWVSEEDGDGAGYDIASFTLDGRPRLIEVKTTNGWERTPFFITRNELAVADERRSDWRLCRLWNFSREPKLFELKPPLDDHVTLTPSAFQASFRQATSERAA